MRALELRQNGGLASLAALVLTLAAAARVGATIFYDIRNAHDSNRLTLEEVHRVLLDRDPGWLEVVIPRAEDLPSDGEIAIFQQGVEVTYATDPPADYEDRSEWYTRLIWRAGSLTGRGQVQVRVTTESTCSNALDGLYQDVSVRPGDCYTSFTSTIQFVPGIAEAIYYLVDTQDQVSGVPEGNLGLAERWFAYVRGTLQGRSCGSPTGIDDAASVWACGSGDCDGLANVYASGMRTLGIPTCVSIEYHALGGPVFPELVPPVPPMGYHAWAGIWSEGMQAFVPLDLGIGQFGFLCCQRVHIAYLEDLSDWAFLALAERGGASFGASSTSVTQASSGAVYPLIRERLVRDGFDRRAMSHEATGLMAPGGPTGVHEPADQPEDPARLLVSNPFHEVLNASLVTARPARATVDVFDAAGRRMARLAGERMLPAGESFFRWLPRDAPSGVYFVRATLEDSGKVLVGRAVRAR